LVDAILVTVEGEEAPIAVEPHAVKSVEHRVGSEASIGPGIRRVNGKIVWD